MKYEKWQSHTLSFKRDYSEWVTDSPATNQQPQIWQTTSLGFSDFKIVLQAKYENTDAAPVYDAAE